MTRRKIYVVRPHASDTLAKGLGFGVGCGFVIAIFVVAALVLIAIGGR
jgi:hypothetical protein